MGMAWQLACGEERSICCSTTLWRQCSLGIVSGRLQGWGRREGGFGGGGGRGQGGGRGRGELGPSMLSTAPGWAQSGSGVRHRQVSASSKAGSSSELGHLKAAAGMGGSAGSDWLLLTCCSQPVFFPYCKLQSCKRKWGRGGHILDRDFPMKQTIRHSGGSQVHNCKCKI